MGNAYNNASLSVTPDGYKASKIYSAKPTDGSGDLAFSRASTAMRRNSAGLWGEVANNVPRLQYPVGGGCPSWLFEAQATNQITYANDLSNANWDKSFCSVAYQSSSYFASLNEAVVSNITNTLYRTIASNSNGTWAFSIVLKKTDADIVQVDLANNTATGAGGKFWFTFSTETITQGNGTTTLIEENNGNYRFQCIMNIVSFGTHVLYITPTTTAGGNTLDSGKGCIFNHAQFEAGSVATSPIITAGSAVTRLADNFLLQNMQTNGIANGLSFTIILDIYYTKSDILLDPLNFAGDQRIGIISIQNGIARCYAAFGQVGTTSVNTGASIGDRVKIALVNNNNTLTIFANGVKASTSATTTTNGISTLRDGMSNVAIGYLSNGLYFYPAALSDSEAIELTTL